MKRILLCDDDPAVRDLLVSFLTSRGYQVEALADGDAALRWLAANRPDMLLLDLFMPGTKGVDVLAKAKDLYPDLPVMVISGGADESLARRTLREGAFDFLLKPFDLATLERHLATKLNLMDQPVKTSR